MELHTQVANSTVQDWNRPMTSTAYELHNLHPLKRAVSLGATSPISGPLVELFLGRTAMDWMDFPTLDHGSRCRGKYP